MTPKKRTTPATNPAEGLEEVTRSVRVLARNSRDLLSDAGEVLERELLMAVTVSERLRDEAVSEELLAEARALRVQSGLRQTAHRTVDLVADAVGVATLTAIRFGEALADQPRPARASGEPSVTPAAKAATSA